MVFFGYCALLRHTEMIRVTSRALEAATACCEVEFDSYDLKSVLLDPNFVKAVHDGGIKKDSVLRSHRLS